MYIMNIWGGTNMTKEESSKIKNEILEMEGSVCIGNSLTIDGVVRIEDVLKIITKYTENKPA